MSRTPLFLNGRRDAGRRSEGPTRRQLVLGASLLALAAPVVGTAAAAPAAGRRHGGGPVQDGAVETVIHPSGWVLRSDDLIHLPTA